MRPPPPAPAPLPDELVEDILLRIPPSDPMTLARAALAEKRWLRLVAGPSFRRRYRAVQRAAPMLGFFCDPDRYSAFVSTSSFRPKPRADRLHLSPEDPARVLTPVFRLVVWDPITDHRVALPRPKGFCDGWRWKAMVLCATPAGSCHHLDCHRGNFIVVLIGQDDTRGMLSCVYSSQDGAWSKIIFPPLLRACFGVHHQWSNAHVGNALYYMLLGMMRNKILKYDLGTREFSFMEPPVMLSAVDEFYGYERIQLTTMEDGQLGLAVLRQSTLYILSTDEEFGWGGTKIIDLEKKCRNYVLSVSATRTFLIGFAGGVGLVFMKDANNGILSVDIKSAQVKVVDKRSCISWIVPYINFCTPAMGVPSKDDEPRAGSSRDVQSCVASCLLRQGK